MVQARVVRQAALVAAWLAAGALEAAMAPQKASPLARREFRHPELQVDQGLSRVEEQPLATCGPLLDALAELRTASSSAYVDTRTGRFATLIPAEPLLPGTGEGNRITWDELGTAAPV